MRELLEEKEVSERRMCQLEADVLALTERLEKTQSENRSRKDDADSLRYEIKWKDERICYLEEQLSEAPRDSADRSAPSSPETEC